MLLGQYSRVPSTITYCSGFPCCVLASELGAGSAVMKRSGLDQQNQVVYTTKRRQVHLLEECYQTKSEL